MLEKEHEMKRNEVGSSEQSRDGATESVTTDAFGGHGNEHVSDEPSGEFRAPTEPSLSGRIKTESHEAVTVLIEGGGFSFNDVFPMGSRELAAENGRAIATFALSRVSPRRRRSAGRNSEE